MIRIGHKKESVLQVVDFNCIQRHLGTAIAIVETAMNTKEIDSEVANALNDSLYALRRFLTP
jgi:pyrroloquinoline quinone (PQQ) biosynthesis protein C